MVDTRNAQVNGISSPAASRGYGHPSGFAFRRDGAGIFRRSGQAKLLRRRQRNSPASARNAIGRPGSAVPYLALAGLLQFLAITRGATMANPLMLIHGYGSSGQAFSKWRDAFWAAGRKVEEISVGHYVTLNNEVTVDDIAKDFQHALHSKDLDKTPFEPVVHSTGMLVMRSLLTGSNFQTSRRGLLKHLVALPPATFASPIPLTSLRLLVR